jgi:hypothetical protein
MERFFSGD